MPMKIEYLAAHAPLVTSERRYVLDYGGRGSGKSVSASQAIITLASRRRGRVLAVRKVARTLRLSVWPRLLSELSKWGLLNRCKVNKSEMSILLPGGSEIDCVGADDPEKIKSVDDAWCAWIEEADSLTEADFDAIDFSLRQGGDKLILTFNPPPLAPGQAHWIKARFIDRDDPQALVLRTTWKDNKFLPADYVQRLLDLEQTNPELYRMWALGEFVGLSGAIFKRWDIVDAIPADAEFIGYGLDFGFSVDPTALVEVWRMDGEYYYREVIYSTGLTNADLISEMRTIGITDEEIVADSAEPKSIEELRRAGFRVKPARKGPDSVRAGIDYMLGFVHHIERGSSNLIKEFGSYSWATDRSGNLQPKPVDAYNHAVDAIRYRLFNPKTSPSLAQIAGL